MLMSRWFVQCAITRQTSASTAGFAVLMARVSVIIMLLGHSARSHPPQMAIATLISIPPISIMMVATAVKDHASVLSSIRAAKMHRVLLILGILTAMQQIMVSGFRAATL